MKKLLLILFSILISFSSYAESVYIDTVKATGTKVYVLTETINLEDGYVYWWDLNNYSEPRSEYNIMGTAMARGGDCENNRYVNIESQMYQGSMATKEIGKRLKQEQEWTTPSSGQIDEKIFNYVCNYAGLVKPEVEKKPSRDGIYKCQMLVGATIWMDEPHIMASDTESFWYMRVGNEISFPFPDSPFLSKLTIFKEREDIPIFEAESKEKWEKLIYLYPYKEKENSLYSVKKGLFKYSSMSPTSGLTDLFKQVIATCEWSQEVPPP